MPRMRSLIITACISLLGSLVVAIALGSPISLMFGLSTSAVLIVQIVERVLTSRKQKVAESNARWAPDAHRMNPLNLATQSAPVTWWSCNLPAPSTRRVRVGTIVRAKQVRVLAVDLAGGCCVIGPVPLAEAAALALRLSAALEYAPHEVVPAIVTEGPDRVHRWRLEVDEVGRGTVVDQLGLEPDIGDVEVDLVPQTFAPVLTQWRAPGLCVEPGDIDLETDGPHAMVIGTTGSGKTEFLIALTKSLAEAHSSQELAFAVFDFKGGGSFARVADLPHVRHLVTDLEPLAVHAALEGLCALVRSRERVMFAAGVSSVTQLEADERPAKVVVVVDEFQALSRQYGKAREIFADIAARGRALGMHLVLATQRFMGSGLEPLSANLALRVCFRVAEAAESSSILGDSRASRALLRPGAGFILRSGRPVAALQVSAADEAGDSNPSARYAPGVTSESLWLEPLQAPLPVPAQPLTRALTEGFALGTLDDHDEMVRATRRWHPRDGAMLAVGDTGSRRALIAVLQAQGLDDTRVLAGHGAGAWDQLLGCASVQRDALVIPCLDEAVASLPMAWRDEFLDELVRQSINLLSRGAPVVIGLAMNSQLRGRLSSISTCEVELSWAAGPAHAGQGARGLLNEEDLRIFQADPAPSPVADLVVPAISLQQRDVVLTPHPKRGRAIGDADTATPARVMSPEEWMFATNRDEPARIFLDGCSPADARALRLSPHPLPPPHVGTIIELRADGSYRRVRVRAQQAEPTVDLAEQSVDVLGGQPVSSGDRLVEE